MSEVSRVKMNVEGRIVIPASIRRKYDMHPGDILLEITEHGVLLKTQAMAIQRLQQWCSDNVPADVSLVEQLIADRRFEAKRESE
jgi:AbrB family looped-hinge helix DNA binding protein